MALPNGSGGYQVGDGNINETVMGYSSAPTTNTGTTTVTLTAAEITDDILILNAGTTSTTYTLPICVTAGAVQGVNDVVSSAKIGSTFELAIVNLTNTSGTATIAAGTGWTLVGLVTMANNTSAQWRARKTSDTTWTLYRIS